MKFIVDHRYSAIKMAEISLEKDVVTDVQQASLNLIYDLRSEIDLILNWLSHDYNSDYKPKIMTNHLAMVESMENLNGLEFETIYLEKMADHDRELMETMAQLDITVYSSKFRELVNKILKEQSAEIHLFNKLLMERN